MNGKGDTPRPLSVSRKTFEDNWDLAFGQKQRNVPDAIQLRKIDVPLIEGEIKPLTDLWMDDEMLNGRRLFEDAANATEKELGVIVTTPHQRFLINQYEKYDRDNRGLSKPPINTCGKIVDNKMCGKQANVDGVVGNLNVSACDEHADELI